MNQGFNPELELAILDGSEWKFGALSPTCIAEIPISLRDQYLPQGEIQKGAEDFLDCATRAPINILEAKFNYLYATRKLSDNNRTWLENKGYVGPEGRITFSDRFIAVLSETSRAGNSLKAPLDTIRTKGLIPKKMLPREATMTFDDYHDRIKITQEMLYLGQAFAQRFSIAYDQVRDEQFSEVLSDDMVDVAGYGWPAPRNGEYPRTDRLFNHAFVLFKNPKYNAFDNYLDWDVTNTYQVTDDFTKKLAPDYEFWQYGYRVIVASQNDVSKQISLMQMLLSALISLYNALLKPKASMPTPEPTTPPEPVKPQPAPSRIKAFALAIEKAEGGGTVNNPGNLKATPFTLSLAPGASKGRKATDGGYFLTFDTYAHGHQALCAFLTYACKNQLKHYKNCTLAQFVEIYAGNPPPYYLKSLSKALNVLATSPISLFL